MANAVLKGSAAIARALGISQKTVQRRARAGALPTRKDGDNTSPWVIARADLERLRRPPVQNAAE